MKTTHGKAPYDEKFKDHIRKLAQEFRKMVYASEYEMEICWCGGTDKKDEDGSTEVASISTDFKYLNLKIHVRPIMYEYWKDGKDFDIGRTMLHEFCHVLVDPVFEFFSHDIGKERYNAANEVRERQVQRVCNAIWDHIPEKIWKRKVKKMYGNKQLSKSKRRKNNRRV